MFSLPLSPKSIEGEHSLLLFSFFLSHFFRLSVLSVASLRPCFFVCSDSPRLPLSPTITCVAISYSRPQFLPSQTTQGFLLSEQPHFSRPPARPFCVFFLFIFSELKKIFSIQFPGASFPAHPIAPSSFFSLTSRHPSASDFTSCGLLFFPPYPNLSFFPFIPPRLSLATAASLFSPHFLNLSVAVCFSLPCPSFPSLVFFSLLPFSLVGPDERGVCVWFRACSAGHFPPAPRFFPILPWFSDAPPCALLFYCLFSIIPLSPNVLSSFLVFLFFLTRYPSPYFSKYRSSLNSWAPSVSFLSPFSF